MPMTNAVRNQLMDELFRPNTVTFPIVSSYTPEEREGMHLNQTTVDRQIALHEAEIERRALLIDSLEKRAAIQQLAEERFAFLYELEEDEHVIFFKLRFAPRQDVINFRPDAYSRWYTYAAIRMVGLWYSTGPKAPKGFTTEEMIRWWTDNDVTDLHVAAEWDPV